MSGRFTSILARVLEVLSIITVAIDAIVNILGHIVKIVGWTLGQKIIDFIQEKNITKYLDNALEWLKKYTGSE